MKSKIVAVVTAAVVSVIALPAFAGDAAMASAEKTYRLNDGSTLYVFTDGKMAREDRFGRAVHLQKGQSLTTADGQQIVATSNEVARLNYLLNKGHQG